ncbi:unnamed protein product [Mytilus edulis]|uniref:Uncharacterized protein n=1 Tax=Mytilus edulis TaxID=6550 RepID=A0A8S3T5M6_MYTED|nr:unnamed protein product [Mytilus edulis]
MDTSKHSVVDFKEDSESSIVDSLTMEIVSDLAIRLIYITNGLPIYIILAYQLTCSGSRFYSLWGECYTRYHSRSRCFEYLRTQALFAPFGGIGIGRRFINRPQISYNDYYNRYHGFRIVDSRFYYNGLAYRLSCSSQRFYSLWGDCYTRYHSRSRCFGYLRTQGLFAPFGGHGFGVSRYNNRFASGHHISYNNYYNRFHGFRIVDRGFYYNGLSYRLSCSSQRFYSLWGDCYTRYHSRNRCFEYLRTQGLFAPFGGHGIGINRFNTRSISGHPISYNEYYNRYHGFRIVDRGFRYNGLGHGIGVSRFNTRSISGHPISYNDYYNRYHGFRIANSQFYYNGLAYRLACNSQRFYRLWGDCYTRYHSRSRCFGYLRTLGLFTPFGGHGIGVNRFSTRSISGHPISYNDYYNRYHGFRIVNSQFAYNGIAYRLSCSSQRFYSLWGNCYTRYHSSSRCFRYLRTQGLFAPYGGHGIGVNRFSTRSISGHPISYNDYYNRYHGFRIANSQFAYNGIAYRLSCSSQRFYSLWGNCYTRYHSRSRCFRYLRTQGLFAPYGGHGIGVNRFSTRSISGHPISYNDYYNRYHGFRIANSQFAYNGIAYRLSCSSQRFYSLWGNCYTRYHSRSRCFRYLRTQGLFAPYGGHGIGVNRFSTRSISGHPISYNDYYNRYHGFRIANSQFAYNGIVYRLSCSSQRFYSLWGNCYTRYHSRSRCFGYLRTQGLFAALGGHVIGAINTGLISGHPISYNDYYKRYHGFRIANSQFAYNGIVYRLSCSSQRFYSLWGNCYTRYHSRSRCFGYLRTQGLFAALGGHVIGAINTGLISRHPISYNDYYKRYHGFRIVNSQFNYRGSAYRLSCSSQRFYSLWGNCYTKFHSRSRCFGYLRTQGLFAPFRGHILGLNRRADVVVHHIHEVVLNREPNSHY